MLKFPHKKSVVRSQEIDQGRLQGARHVTLHIIKKGADRLVSVGL